MPLRKVADYGYVGVLKHSGVMSGERMASWPPIKRLLPYRLYMSCESALYCTFIQLGVLPD